MLHLNKLRGIERGMTSEVIPIHTNGTQKMLFIYAIQEYTLILLTIESESHHEVFNAIRRFELNLNQARYTHKLIV